MMNVGVSAMLRWNILSDDNILRDVAAHSSLAHLTHPGVQDWVSINY